MDDRLFRHGSVMLLASAITMVLNYVFQVFMGRSLGPVGYGTLGVMVSIYYVLWLPVSTVQLVIAKFTSKFRANGEHGKISSLYAGSMRKFFYVGIIMFVVFFALSPYLAGFLRIPRNTIVLFGLTLIPGVIVPVSYGALQGLQMFGYFALNQVLGVFLKLIAGVFLVYVGFGVNGAIAAYGISYAIIIVIALVSLKFVLKTKREELVKADIYRYTWPVFVSLACLALLTNVDLMMVKHYLNPEDAGHYNAVSMLGKVMYFASLALSVTLFPKVSEKTAGNGRLLSKGLLLMLAISVPVCLVYMAFPETVLGLVFGSEYSAGSPVLVIYALAMLCFSLSIVMAHYNLSAGNYGFIIPMAVLTMAEAALIALRHDSMAGIAKTVLGASVLLLLMMVVQYGTARKFNG